MRDVIAFLTLCVYLLLRVLITFAVLWPIGAMVAVPYDVSGLLTVVLFVGVMAWHGRWAVKQWAWRKGEIEKGTWDAVKGNNT